MANTIGYGQGAVNNTNAWGQGAKSGSSFSNLQSTEYDGVDDHIKTNATYSQLDGQNKATFSMWVKPTLSATGYVLYISEGSNIQFGIAIFNTGQIQAYINQGAYYLRTATSALTTGSWQHILVCIDLTLAFSSRGAIFVNGVDVTNAQNLNRSTFGTSTNFLFVADRTALNLPYGGLIDEIGIYSGTDLRNDVATIYNSGTPNNLNDNGLTAPTNYYRFEGTGTTATDSGSGGNNGTLTNGVTRSSDVPT